MKILNKVARYISDLEYYQYAYDYTYQPGLKLLRTEAQYFKDRKEHYIYHANNILRIMNET